MNTLRRLFVAFDGYIDYALLYMLYVMCTIVSVILLVAGIGPSLLHHIGFASLLLVGMLTFSLPTDIVANRHIKFICEVSLLCMVFLTIVALLENVGHSIIGTMIIIILKAYIIIIEART